MLQRLMHDHKHIAILLNILSNKLTRLADGQGVNFNLVRDIVEYMQSYAEHSHHPLEDIIFDYYSNKIGQANSGQLYNEHHRLAEASSALVYSLNMILSDVVISRDQLVKDLQEYIELQEKHMQYEERDVFPNFVNVFDEKDWQKVTVLCEKRLIEDPLFNDSNKTVFEDLRAYIEHADNK
ncbi:hemerythrin domain-containing protein [Shewanella vesiculosa]|jgi:hemerythrin-like domain-containing protein|uniref:hemerythrin domain-containing protein n=1 Tax=Shewanella vesiculosa TaxID=518738 RepID=UPI003CFEBE3E|tara:strand:- start:1997 stop:2539 length:543 start_codon:yes stop_codon:yes gene_type:complete